MQLCYYDSIELHGNGTIRKVRYWLGLEVLYLTRYKPREGRKIALKATYRKGSEKQNNGLVYTQKTELNRLRATLATRAA